ncbi:MAG: hypothetical protein E7L17_14570 [Clostridium sp.]|uniref:hypothetical protein n=1 Tax=Clostridium sp. TaxID=1506 RepID=UPI0029081C92|nr:hypothetical protein [Clostridium sp.]MDU7339324.1 hypothetical protein [Clostridium sp.]
MTLIDVDVLTFEIPDILTTEITYDSNTHKTFIRGYPDNAEHAIVVLAALVKVLVDSDILEPDEALGVCGFAAGLVEEESP